MTIIIIFLTNDQRNQIWNWYEKYQFEKVAQKIATIQNELLGILRLRTLTISQDHSTDDSSLLVNEKLKLLKYANGGKFYNWRWIFLFHMELKGIEIDSIPNVSIDTFKSQPKINFGVRLWTNRPLIHIGLRKGWSYLKIFFLFLFLIFNIFFRKLLMNTPKSHIITFNYFR